MADLNIREVDPELLRLVKVAAAERGVTMREWVLEAVQVLLEKGRRLAVDEKPIVALSNSVRRAKE